MNSLSDGVMRVATPAETLASLVDRQKMLDAAGVKIQSPASLGAVRKKAATIREKFRAERKSAVLKRGVGWTNLLAESGAAVKDVETSLQAGWRDFRTTIHSGEAPGVIEKRIARTPQNIEALSQYQEVYSQFSALFLLPPTSPATVAKARELAQDLAKVAVKFNYDVSPDVKAFLAAVQAGGASLGLLTGDVLDWLAENNAADGYLIRASGRQ